ncbi:MAG: hypothetical protein K6E35_04130 [Bacteroidales bacterium]|nr:hypothetical protein [Bacteroidales bacterium]
MKKILNHSLLVAAITALVALTGCNQNELDTDQYSGTVALAAISPNPVMRGGELRIIGSNLENVSEVHFAGDVVVTDIQTVKAGARSEIRITVPTEGPEVGPVTIVTENGNKASSRFDLEYTEPIVIDSFTPAEALSGDVITIQGDYLNNVREVIFGGDVFVTEFIAQERHKLQVKVPAAAITGPIIVGDVNELEDESTIPNQIYSATELTIGKPSVTTADKATYKSGDVITVSGEHLDMIQTVNLTGAAAVEFTLAEDFQSISFPLPAAATDGNIILVSYAGDEFDGGEIETVTVADLVISSLAEDGRYKAGAEVKIAGSDLDLVTKVEFTGAEATWVLQDGDIIANLPSTAKDGVVTVSLASGKQAQTTAITVVKPVASSTDVTTAVAGKGQVKISGTDLDLVTDVKLGDKAQTFIPCEFEFQEGVIVVKIPATAYDGPITLTADNGYETVTEQITITYDEVVSIVFDQPSYELGKNITISGNNLMKIEAISIKGKKVTDFLTRTDTAMAFVLPDGFAPGIYRLDLVLTDGSALTWSVPFTVTASYEKRILWEGNREITWGDGGRVALPYALFDGVPAGSLMYLCYKQKDQVWAQAQVNYGDWTGINFNEGEVTFDGTLVPTDVYGWFSDGVLERVTPVVLTEEILAKIAAKHGDFEGEDTGIIIQGSDLIFTEVYVNVPGATETVIWEGNSTIDGWSGDQSLAWGAFDWSTVSAGQTLKIYATPIVAAGEWWCISLRHGDSWGALAGAPGQYDTPSSPLCVELTQEMIDDLVTNGGMVITGTGFTMTKIAIE